MKLQKKMLTVVSALVVLQVVLLIAGVILLNRYQQWQLQKNYGFSGDEKGLTVSSARVFDGLMEQLEIRLRQEMDRRPDVLADESYLDSMNTELSGKNTSILVFWDAECTYNGLNFEGILKDYLDMTTPGRLDDKIYFSRENERYLIGSMQFSVKDRRVTVYLAMNLSTELPDNERTVYGIGLMGLMVIILATLMMVSWLQSEFVQPLKKLQAATRAIRDGNLDYSLTVEGRDEIADLYRDFEDMRKRLKDTTEERLKTEQDNKILISNISHDLKTPLTAIKGYSEGILEGVASSPEKLDRYVKTIYHKACDMDMLVDELTLYSKIDTNRIPYNFAKISVNAYFADCVEELETELEAKGLELIYQNSLKEDATVIGDPEQLKRVINNIISNSVKYMDKEHGIIRIRIRDAQDFVRVEMEDNGKGIAARDLPHVFDRFFRTDSSRNSRTGGSGIGLSIVKKIIEDHGGRIWATGREGFGTTMIFELRKYQEVIS